MGASWKKENLKVGHGKIRYRRKNVLGRGKNINEEFGYQFK